MEWLVQYKWFFFIMGEIIFWLSLIGFLILRYWFDLKRWGVWFILIFILNDLWLITIGTLDYMQTGQLNKFQLVILAFVLYAITVGKQDFKRLDRYMRRKVASWKGHPLPAEEETEERILYGFAYAWKELKMFTMHLLLYVVVMAGFYFLFGFSIQIDLNQMNTDGFMQVYGKGLFKNEAANRVNQIWTVVLMVDGLITLSYWLFPKKPE